jgi:hypothetical protein
MSKMIRDAGGPRQFALTQQQRSIAYVLGCALIALSAAPREPAGSRDAENQETVRRYLRARTIPAIGKRVRSSDLCGDYEAWSYRNHDRAMSRVVFCRCLADLNYRLVKGRFRYWLDLALLPTLL